MVNSATFDLIVYRPGMPLPDLNTLELSQLFSTLVEGPQLDQLIDLAMYEDLGTEGDLTTRATVDSALGVDAAIKQL